MGRGLTLEALKCDALAFEGDRVDLFATIDRGERRLVWATLLAGAEAHMSGPGPFRSAGQTQPLEIGPLAYQEEARLELEVQPAGSDAPRVPVAEVTFASEERVENYVRFAPELDGRRYGHYTLRFAREEALGEGEVTASVLRVRAEPSLRARIVGRVRRGDPLLVFERSGAWLRVAWGDRRAFVHGDYVDLPDAGGGEAGASGEPLYEVEVTCDVLRIRARPSTQSSRILGRTRQGDRHEVYDEEPPWLQIQHEGRPAWIHSDFVQRGAMASGEGAAGGAAGASAGSAAGGAAASSSTGAAAGGGASAGSAAGGAAGTTSSEGIPLYRYYFKWETYLSGAPTDAIPDSPINRSEVLIRRSDHLLYGLILWGRLLAVDADDLLPYLGGDPAALRDDSGYRAVADRLRDAVWAQAEAALAERVDPFYRATPLPAGDDCAIWVDHHMLLLEEDEGGLRPLLSPDRDLLHRDYAPPVPPPDGDGWQQVSLPNPRTPSPVVRIQCRRYAFVPRLLDRVGVLRRRYHPQAAERYRWVARVGTFVEALDHLVAATFVVHPDLEEETTEQAEAYRELRRATRALRAVQRARVLTAFSWSGRGSRPPFVVAGRKAWALYRTLRDPLASADLRARAEQLSPALRDLVGDVVQVVLGTPARFVRHADGDVDALEDRDDAFQPASGSVPFMRRYERVERGPDGAGFYQAVSERWPELVEANLLDDLRDLLPDGRVDELAERAAAGQLPRREPDATWGQRPIPDTDPQTLFARAWEGLEAHGEDLQADYVRTAREGGDDLPPWGHAQEQARRLGSLWLPISGTDARTVRRLLGGGEREPYPALLPAPPREPTGGPVATGGAGWFELELLDPRGRPQRGVEVTLTASDGVQQVARTNRAGVARWEDLAPGEVRWEVQDEAASGERA